MKSIPLRENNYGTFAKFSPLIRGQKWREEILLQEARPTVFADLGYGVLDTAMVEIAAYCLEAVGKEASS